MFSKENGTFYGRNIVRIIPLRISLIERPQFTPLGTLTQDFIICYFYWIYLTTVTLLWFFWLLKQNLCTKMNENAWHFQKICLCFVYGCKYPGNFMRIKSHVVKNETRIKMKPMAVSKMRLSFGFPGACVWSIMMKPRPPTVNRKLLAKPSMMYWPLIRYGMNATGRECPCSSVVEPTEGGSTITS